jgi:predicted MFS family arabinose efflux permease
MVSGAGAAVSMTLAGAMSDHFGGQYAFFGLGGIAILAVMAVLTLMPETRENDGS